ncbi:MAG: hypothetical protein ACFFER_18770, partial [Candidatus Thorarchaeota archaeon]
EILEKGPSGRLHVKNKGDVGKKKVPIKQGTVESDLVYLLVRGREISKWSFKPNLYVVIPHLSNTGWRAIPEETMMTEYPEAYKFLHQFKEMLNKRSGKKQLRKNHPMYILGSIGKHTFEPFKVAWGSISKQVKAAVLEPLDDPYLGRKIPMLEHSAMYLETASWEEAHFVCALLNSTPSQVTINCFKGMGAYGNISRLISIPRFNVEDSTHLLLSDLSREAHRRTRAGKSVASIEAAIDKYAIEVWDLDEPEMEGILGELNEF